MHAVRIRPDPAGNEAFRQSWWALDDETIATLIFEIDMLKRLGPSGDTAVEYLNGRFETHALPVPGTEVCLLFVADENGIVLLSLYQGPDSRARVFEEACTALGLVNPSRDQVGGDIGL